MAAAKSPEHLALGRALRTLRAQHGLSQEELAARAGLHRNYIGGIERGEINTSFGVLLAITRALDVRMSTLIETYEREDPGAEAGTSRV
jgi:transcriptional regulator with XRE-family HTH domain